MLVLLFFLFQPFSFSQSPSREYDILFHHAMLQRQKGNQDAAFDLLRRCLELRPDASEANFFLALSYADMGDKEHELAFHIGDASPIWSAWPRRISITSSHKRPLP